VWPSFGSVREKFEIDAAEGRCLGFAEREKRLVDSQSIARVTLESVEIETLEEREKRGLHDLIVPSVMTMSGSGRVTVCRELIAQHRCSPRQGLCDPH
jgi:hypothetical protein